MVKDIMFAKQMIEHFGIEVELPIIIKCDNIGAICLGK